MMIFRAGRLARSILTVCCVASLGACSLFGSMSSLPPEEQVRIRAQEWADALLDGDLWAAYEYTSPSYREFADAGRYNARVAGVHQWKTATVRDVECTETACEVTLILEYQAYKSEFDIRRPRRFTWVLSEGEWWLYVPAQ